MYIKHWFHRFFYAPDKGGTGGGGSATNPTASETDPNDPFRNIDYGNLDDGSKAVIEAAKAQFATLQTEKQRSDEQMRQFQSRADRTEAELSRIKGSITGEGTKVDPATAAAQEIEQHMVSLGVAPQAAKAQAPIMAKLLDEQRKNILAEVGKGVAPLGNMVMNHQAEQAFNLEKSQDTTGALSIPDVAQAVWDSCIEIAKGGTPITPETVKNLKGMHFMAHAEKNPGIFATLQMNPVRLPGAAPTVQGRPASVQITTGGFNYPGSTFTPYNNPPLDPNAPKTVLDAGTKAALSSIFANLKPGHEVK